MPASPLYHVVLDGQGFLIDPASYRRTIATPFSIKTRTGDPRYSDLVSGAAWAQSLWTDGVVDGSTEYDPRWPTRSGDAATVDVSYPGDVRLGRTMINVSGAPIGGFAVFGSQLYGFSLNSGIVYATSNGVTWSPSIDLNTLSPTAALGAITVAHGYLFVGAADSGKIYAYDGTTWSYWDVAPAAGGLVANRIYALCSIRLPGVGWPTALLGIAYGTASGAAGVIGAVAAPTGAISAVSTYALVDYPVVTFLVTGHDAVYFGTVDTRTGGIRGEVFQWNLAESGQQSSIRSLALFTDNALTSLTRFREQAYAGTYTGGKIGRLSTADLVPFFRLPEVARTGSPPAYTKQVKTLAIDNDRLYAAFNDASGLCLWQFDGTAWTRFATGGSGDPVALAQFGGNIYVTTGTTVYRVVMANYAASGTLTTAWFDAELGSIPKAFSRITLAFAPLLTGTSIAVAYALDDAAAFTALGTANMVGSSTANFAFPTATDGLRIRLRFTLASSNASYTPQLRTFVLEYQLQPALTATGDPPTVRGEYRWDPLLEGTQELPLVRLDRSSEPKTGAQLRAALWASAAKAGPLTYVDTDGSTHSVWLAELEDHLLRDKEVITRQGWRGSVKLVEA